ncbi:MAG: hypothetical protein LBQ44_06255 [Treponema sp.]|jgi:hypothetical protein|nr:hypothetical protein [Treponema sp.]
MLILAGIVSAALAGLIVYLAVSGRTSRPVKIAAITALIAISAALTVCAIVIAVMFLSPAAGEEAVYADLNVVPESYGGNQDLLSILIFAAAVLVAIALVVFFSLRGQRKIQEKLQAPKYRKES